VPPGEVGDLPEPLAADAPTDHGDPDPAQPVLLPVHADVVGAPAGCTDRRRPVRQLPAEVLRLQDLTEPLDPPVGDQELQPRPVAQPSVAVVAEDADDAGPDLGHLGQRDPHTDPLGQVRVGAQPPADPQVEAGPEGGVHDADEGHVVELVRDVVGGRPGDGGLELARQVRELGAADVAPTDLSQRPGAVDDLVGVDARDG
jgi:hypothetical protein